MKTKNKSVKRKISFEDDIKAHSSSVCKKANVGSSTTIVSVQILPDEQGSSSKPQDSSASASRHVPSCVSSAGTMSTTIHYQQCTPTKDVTHVTSCTNGEPDVYVPDDEHMHITSSTLATASTNYPYNMQLPHASYCIPLEYMHMGRCTCICHYCGATFWETEKNIHSAIGGLPVYNRCYHGGRVVLRPPLDSINNGKGPYVFRISGQIYHWIGSMCPPEGEAPRFLQLYIYDTNNEVSNRMSHFGGEYDSGLKRDIVERLIEFLDNHNALVELFRTARNKQQEVKVPELKVKLYNVFGTRRYDLPTRDTISAIVFGGTSISETEFDLIVEEHSRTPQRVNKLHPCYMSLQFPLLFH
ncbi:hypothetical protein Tco_0267508 [Tanacetum coccineum]